MRIHDHRIGMLDYARRKLVATVYAVGAVPSIVAGVIFVLAFADALNLPYLADTSARELFFCASLAMWVIFSLQDAALDRTHTPSNVQGLSMDASATSRTSFRTPYTEFSSGTNHDCRMPTAAALTIVMNTLLFPPTGIPVLHHGGHSHAAALPSATPFQ